MATEFDKSKHRRVLTDQNGNPIPQVYDKEANNGEGGFVALEAEVFSNVIDGTGIDIATEETLSTKLTSLETKMDTILNDGVKQTGSIVKHEIETIYQNRTLEPLGESGDAVQRNDDPALNRKNADVYYHIIIIDIDNWRIRMHSNPWEESGLNESNLWPLTPDNSTSSTLQNPFICIPILPTTNLSHPNSYQEALKIQNYFFEIPSRVGVQNLSTTQATLTWKVFRGWH